MRKARWRGHGVCSPHGESMIGESWGVEPAETAIPFPCDRFPETFDAGYYRGVTVHATPAVVFRWLCQLRAAPYAYDWLDNWGKQSPRQLIPGLENLKLGQTVMTIFNLIDFEADRQLTCRIK